MSPNSARVSQGVSGLPIWNGSSSDPTDWDNYRYAIHGYCAGKGLSALLKKTYHPVKQENGDATDQDLQEML